VSGQSGASGNQISEQHCEMCCNLGRCQELLSLVDVYKDSAEHSSQISTVQGKCEPSLEA